MRINADLSLPARVDTEAMPWTPSPQPGVERKMLDRDGGEIARATSLVRYAPGSVFPAHEHGGGEEILVLAGTFEDEAGRYPAGTYLRNPIGSRHAPRSAEGCTLLVKLRQFVPGDGARVVIDTRRAEWQPGRAAGVSGLPLHSFGSERVLLSRWAPGTLEYPAHDHPGGEEVFVVEGALEDEQGRYPRGTWIRLPVGSRHKPASPEGCLLWVKLGHLAPATAPAG